MDCKDLLPLREFYVSKGNKGGFHTACKVCYKVRQNISRSKYLESRRDWLKEYRRNNKEKLSEYAKNYRSKLSGEKLRDYRRKRQETKRIHRAKKYGSGGRHTEAEWRLLLEVCNYRCVCCGGVDNISRDHIVPLSLGGSDDIKNIQPLCRSCNSSKNRWHAKDYRTGEILVNIESRLQSVKCSNCGKSFKLTNIRRRFCTRKCNYSYHNSKKKKTLTQ